MPAGRFRFDLPRPARMGTAHSRRFAATIALALACCLGQAGWAKGPPADPRAEALITELGIDAATTPSAALPGWRVPTRVVVSRASPAVLERLQAAAPGVEVVVAQPGEAGKALLSKAQVAIGLCDEATLSAAPSLHWIQTWWVGVEDCVGVPGLAERGIVLTNTQRTSAIPIAEHAIAMVMALARGLPAYARKQQAHDWSPRPEGVRVMELHERTLLVVGLGGIGTEVARRAHGLGMRVIATRNSSREGPDFVAKVGLSDELHALAAEADVIVSAVPLTPATTGLFDATFFAAAKPGALFLNVGRGGSVVTDDLVAALRSGQIGGAGLDVTEPEPLPAGHPLWSLANVVITPHVAATSDAQTERYLLLVTENLRRYVAGEPLLNVVDIARGY
ncbi:MAG: D-2-hydroxyacid dehydrogenase [Xanthomonadales bacterium]|nr:D-2-hydroxyacid dehydrogenase [Xanthomonadales bacterium]